MVAHDPAIHGLHTQALSGGLALGRPEGGLRSGRDAQVGSQPSTPARGPRLALSQSGCSPCRRWLQQMQPRTTPAGAPCHRRRRGGLPVGSRRRYHARTRCGSSFPRTTGSSPPARSPASLLLRSDDPRFPAPAGARQPPTAFDTMINGKRIAVVLPAYNAAKTLEACIGEIPREFIDDVILVDDQPRRHGGDRPAFERGAAATQAEPWVRWQPEDLLPDRALSRCRRRGHVAPGLPVRAAALGRDGRADLLRRVRCRAGLAHPRWRCTFRWHAVAQVRGEPCADLLSEPRLQAQALRIPHGLPRLRSQDLTRGATARGRSFWRARSRWTCSPVPPARGG